MKLVIAIVSNDDSRSCLNAMIENHFQVTKLATSGGFLRAGNTTLLCGCEDEKVQLLLRILKENCSRRQEMVSTAPIMDPSMLPYTVTIEAGGASVFVLPVDAFYRL